jgi:hypothetical protein
MIFSRNHYTVNVDGRRLLRTPNVERMGYLHEGRLSGGAFLIRPEVSELLQRLGASASTADNMTGLKPFFGNFFDQGLFGSCTSQSTSKAIRASLVAKGIALPAGCDDFSQRMIYTPTRQIERGAASGSGALSPLGDSGCMPDDCITCVSDLGVVGMPSGHMTSDGRYNDIDSSNINEEVSLEDEETTELAVGAYDVDINASSFPRSVEQSRCL